MHKIFLSLFITFTLNAQIVDGVAAVVKDFAITLYDVKKEMQLSKLTATQALDVLIRKKLEEIECQERKITVSSSEVYDDIKKTAEANNMTVSQFYDAVRESNGLTSSQLKEKMKEKLMSQKLYGAVAYTHMSEPSASEIEEYYTLHKDAFMHPTSFNITIYIAQNEAKLQEKIDNPMFYSPEIQVKDEVLQYERISPELASLLEKTPINSFSQIVPNGKNGYMSFYIKSVKLAEEDGTKGIENKISNLIMATKREQVLGDYFERLRNTADIKTLRMPE